VKQAKFTYLETTFLDRFELIPKIGLRASINRFGHVCKYLIYRAIWACNNYNITQGDAGKCQTFARQGESGSPVKANWSFRVTLGITSILFTSLLAFPAYAINEGGKCDSVKFGNSLVMSNGKIHGGSFGSNQNYSGPLYLCDGGRWVYWKMAEPAAVKKQTVNVRPGQGCNKIGRVVESTNHGTLVCSYVRAGKIRALLWTQG
jgi:hypothetical protein